MSMITWIGVLAVSVLLVSPMAGIPDGTSSHDADRTGEYVGAYPLHPVPLIFSPLKEECQYLLNFVVGESCPVPHPSFVIFQGTCDTQDPPMPGVGVVLFCAIVQGSTITIRIDDLILEPQATIGHATCISKSSDWGWQHQYLSLVHHEATISLPDLCANHPDDEEGTTRVAVFVETLNPVAGEVSLTYDEVGPI